MFLTVTCRFTAPAAHYATWKNPSGKLLDYFEKRKIVGYKRESLSIRDISSILNRSPKFIWTYLNIVRDQTLQKIKEMGTRFLNHHNNR